MTTATAVSSLRASAAAAAAASLAARPVRQRAAVPIAAAATTTTGRRAGAAKQSSRASLKQRLSSTSALPAAAPRPPLPLRRRRFPRPARALDAALPFDSEARAAAKAAKADTLSVGIVGFGTFGRFLAARLVKAGHSVSATSRTDYRKEAEEIGVEFFQDADDFCERHPDVVVLATSILSAGAVLRSLPAQRLKRSTLFVDVLSVKEYPKRAMLAALPRDFDIVCTHPMFGPDSGSGSWAGLPLVFDRVRVGKSASRQRRADSFLKFFEKEGCRMVEMECEEHDRLSAGTQFVTHTVGRVLGEMQLGPTPIDTRGYESLLSLVGNTANDSFDLYYGLFMYNQNATEELERLERAFDDVKTALFRRLHGALRAEVFDSSVSEAGREGGSDSVSIAGGGAVAASSSRSDEDEDDEEEEEEDEEEEAASRHAAAAAGNGAATTGKAAAGAK